jgi:hypothetical protein
LRGTAKRDHQGRRPTTKRKGSTNKTANANYVYPKQKVRCVPRIRAQILWEQNLCPSLVVHRPSSASFFLPACGWDEHKFEYGKEQGNVLVFTPGLAALQQSNANAFKKLGQNNLD